MAKNDSSASIPALKRNLTIWDGIIMSAALMGPAVSTYFNTGIAAGFAGPTIPLVFLFSLIACVIVAHVVGRFTQQMPTSGAFYTFTAQGLGPKFGFVTGWLTFLGYSVLEPAELALIGAWISEIVERSLGWHVSWIPIALFFTALVYLLSVLGIKESLRTSLILFAAEVVVLVILIGVILIRGGKDGILSGAPFQPSLSPTGLSGMALAMVYGLLSFVGFESSATLGEEVVNAKKNLYKAIMGATVLVGTFYVVATYAEVLGFGVGSWEALSRDQAPFDTLARSFMGNSFAVLVDLAGVTSIFAVIIGVHNAVVRILFAMGREHVLPSRLGYINPKYHTPTGAITAQTVFSTVVLLALGLWVGPRDTYAYLGAILTFCLIPVYILVSMALVRYQKLIDPANFNLVKVGLLPTVAALVMIIPLVGSVYPVPDPPYNYFPYLVLVYALIGIGIAWNLGRTKPEVLTRAGKVLGAVDEASAD